MAAGDVTPGRRVDSLSDCLKPGDYWLGLTNVVGETFHEMFMRVPCSREQGGVSIRRINDDPSRSVHHDFVEHDDGTVTVVGSILCHVRDKATNTWGDGWHGYLERGVWREV